MSKSNLYRLLIAVTTMAMFLLSAGMPRGLGG